MLVKHFLYYLSTVLFTIYINSINCNNSSGFNSSSSSSMHGFALCLYTFHSYFACLFLAYFFIFGVSIGCITNTKNRRNKSYLYKVYNF